MVGKRLMILALLASVLYMCNALPDALPDGYNHGAMSYRAKREVSTDTVRDCSDPDNEYLPPTATPTTDRLLALRDEMYAIVPDEPGTILAYIIPSEDSHNSEYIAECHERRAYISGFTGSAGLAIVTDDESALWTDGRYYLQAEQQLDCNWELMKSSEAETPRQWDWLLDVLPPGNSTHPTLVAFDPTLISINTYNSYQNAFIAARSDGKYLSMYAHEENLIDIIWDDQPECPNNPVYVLDIQWTGVDWWNKVLDHRDEMDSESADMMVLHALDDTAWFFNLRGSDILYNPVFFAYTIIELGRTTLFVNDISKLIVGDVHDHLLQDPADQTAHCADVLNNHKCLYIREYDDFLGDLENMAAQEEITKVWISTGASYGIYGNVPEEKQYARAVPTQVMKAQKNANEVNGMREGNLQDAVAMIEWLHWMEGAVVDAAGDFDKLNEVIADEKVQEFRAEQPDFVMPSFGAISAFGANGAVIHYGSTPETNVAITDDDMYLLDSGGQYKCGATTDTTRTMHYGVPEDRHKEAYTRVLQGAIDLSLSIFPQGTWGRDVDIHARQQLWNYGWNYNHGTGHGLGAMLNVHEGPHRISMGYRPGEVPLKPGMFSSDEPGYYEDHDYGVRLETVFMVTEANTEHNFDGKMYLTFEEVCFVPFEPNLIKKEMFTRRQVDWLNTYNKITLDHVGPLVEAKNKEAYEWLVERTQPIEYPDPDEPEGPSHATTAAVSNIAILSVLTLLSSFFIWL